MNYSVLLPVYKTDNPRYFKLSLESILNQTVKSNDIVIVKDGMVPQAIQEIIDSCSRQYPNIINQIQLEKNIGLGLALNKGIEACKNELIARMDSDDISMPDRCEKQLDMFRADPELDIVGCPVKEFTYDVSNIIGVRDVPLDNESIYKYCKRRDPFNHPTVMYRKSKLKKFGAYEDYRKNQDTALWIRLLSNGCKCANHPEYLLMFRFDENTYKKRKSWINTKLLIQIRKKAWKSGFCSLNDYLIVAAAQTVCFLMPVKLQRYIYKVFLRK